MAAKTLEQKMQDAAPQIPQVEGSDPIISGERMQPMDSEYVHGKFTHVQSREPYVLCKHDSDTYGRTHSLKNSRHFWQGTEAEFRLAFEKA